MSKAKEEKTTRKLLVIDLHGTLAAESADFRPRPGAIAFMKWCFESEKDFDIGFWTAASKDYAEPVIRDLCGKNFERLAFVWYGDRCTHVSPLKIYKEQQRDKQSAIFSDDFIQLTSGTTIMIKDLSRIWHNALGKRRGYRRTSTIVLDDNPVTYARNYGNAQPICTWNEADTADTALNVAMVNICQRFLQADVRKRKAF